MENGSVLSVTLLAISNNIFMYAQSLVHCSLFTHDSAIYVSAKCLGAPKHLLQLNVRKLEEWADVTGFNFSAQKTNCISFSRLQNTQKSLSCYWEEQNTLLCREGRFCCIHSHLNWVSQVKEFKAKCLALLDVPVLQFICRTEVHPTKMSPDVLQSTYKASCLPYGPAVYSSARPILKMLDTTTTLQYI